MVADVTALTKQFDHAMFDVYERAKREVHYNASYFLQMISQDGGLETARRLLAKEDLSQGFTELWMKGRLDLTVEAQVLRPEFRPLFTAEEVAIAERRLRELGYTVP